GICVKSHGGTDAVGFAHALEVAVELILDHLNDEIRTDYNRLVEGGVLNALHDAEDGKGQGMGRTTAFGSSFGQSGAGKAAGGDEGSSQ
ncbi:MAG: hypothetical protein ACPGO3_11625, partial [Magnetospiraceae bacterium]